MPLVTVVIPNYNHARFLPERIASVVNQRFKDFELLLLDDASTDNSCDVLEQYAKADSRARCLFNERNSGGTFPQWNRGVAQATGEFVWLAESDDSADPMLLSYLVDLLLSNPTCGIAYCQSWDMTQHGSVTGTWESHTEDLTPNLWISNFVASGPMIFSHYIFTKNIIPNASAVLFRRACFNQVGGADERYRVAGDWKLWADMLLVSDLAFISIPLNYFRRGGTARASSLKAGAGLYENLQLFTHLLSCQKITPNAYDCGLNNFALALIRAAASRTVSLRQTRDLCLAAMRLDPHFLSRLARLLSKSVRRRLG